jgi:cation diffusion facilitator CzcD-associated flavoprotein CzcO
VPHPKRSPAGSHGIHPHKTLTEEEGLMTHTDNHMPNIRVLNLSTIDLPCEHLLNSDSNDVGAMVKKIRFYADLPFVWIVSREKTSMVPGLLSALKTIRSPCYPYAIFAVDGATLKVDDTELDVVSIDNSEAGKICGRMATYLEARFKFDENKLLVDTGASLPSKVDVAIIGAGITGVYAANRLREAGISYAIIEKRDRVGGIWSQYANTTSQVNSSECGYRLFEKNARSNRDHSYTREILEDIAFLAGNVKDQLYLETEVEKIAKCENGYTINTRRNGNETTFESTGVILAINDRVGLPREIAWKNQAAFQGQIVSGISNGTLGVDWRDKRVVIVGMGAFAIENARTALEAGARHVTVVCRRHGTICPKIIDYLNFATPYDNAFKHDKKSNMRNMMYWKKLYDLSGATQPECWMGKVKHDGHTISVSDIWFIAHYLKKIGTITGEISDMTAKTVIVNDQHHIDADIVVNCVGFERNAPLAEALSGYKEMYSNNYIDKDFMYLADAYIDADAFNSLFGSSVLEMVKFYMEVYVTYFNNPEFETMMQIDQIEKLPIEQRKWSHYIKGAMALIQNDRKIHDIAWKLVGQRTDNFLQAHDLSTYIEQNKREWLDMHEMLTGRPMKEEECLPYVFEKMITSSL